MKHPSDSTGRLYQMHDFTDGVVGSASLDGIAQKAISRHLPNGQPISDNVVIVDVAVVRHEKPTLLDVVAQADSSVYHVVIGLMDPGDEPRFFSDGADQVLGLYDYNGQLFVAVDALEEQDMVSDLVKLLYTPPAVQESPAVQTISDGQESPGVQESPGGNTNQVSSVDPASSTYPVLASTSPAGQADSTDSTSPSYQDLVLRFNMVRKDSDTDELVVYIVDESVICTVVKKIVEMRSPNVDLLITLDSCGFNNMFAPLTVWERGGYILGLVQEYMPGTSTGWDVALTSLRDLCSARCAPQEAGADFAPDAFKIGEMLGRMHIALEGESNRRRMDIASKLPEISSWPESDRLQAQLDRKLLEESDIHYYEIPVHGNFDLVHIRRGEYGWYLGDMMQLGSQQERLYSSPLYDLATVLCSLHEVALDSLKERDPLSADETEGLVSEWEKRNAEMIVNGYLNVSGVAGMVPTHEGCFYAMLNMMSQEYRNHNNSLAGE